MSRRRPFVIGLTGSIGMGKSTAAGLFRELGIETWDADAAVARLYGPGGAAVPAIAALDAGLVRGGQVDREALRRWIDGDAAALGRIEAVVHPLVAADRAGFLQRAQSDIVVLEIPLLFETGAQEAVDLVAVVSAPPDVQRARVLARPGMTEDRFRDRLARQMPDSEKRRRADVVIPGRSLEETRAAVHDLVKRVRQGLADA